VAVKGVAEMKKLTNLLLKHYNIRKIRGNPYHAGSNGVIERGYRQIADALSKLVLETGPGIAAEVRVRTGKTVLFGSRTV
jgi:hypothetical protein